MKKVIFSILLLTFLLTTLSGCKKEQTQQSGELTIATLFDNRFLEFAARQYEELNEGVTITINIYTSAMGQQEGDTEKYSQTINTALMSGMGEDIIDVSRLAWVHLADKNKLLDLNGKIEFSSDAYYKNVLDAYLYNGGCYAIPLCFTFDAYKFVDTFNNIIVPDGLTLNELLNLANKHPESLLFNGGAGMPRILAYMLFNLNFNEFIDVRTKEANINNEQFINLLESINSITYSLRNPQQGETALMLESTLYNPTHSNNGIMDYTGMFLLTNDKGEGLFSQFGFLPSVNANSANQELAVDFLRFLLSEEMQSSPELMFNPVNKNSSAEMATLYLAQVRAGGYAADGFDLENNIRLFNELCENLAVVEYSDYFVKKFVMDELTRYFDGEISAEQAARNLQSRLNTYLKE